MERGEGLWGVPHLQFDLHTCSGQATRIESFHERAFVKGARGPERHALAESRSLKEVLAAVMSQTPAREGSQLAKKGGFRFRKVETRFPVHVLFQGG